MSSAVGQLLFERRLFELKVGPKGNFVLTTTNWDSDLATFSGGNWSLKEVGNLWAAHGTLCRGSTVTSLRRDAGLNPSLSCVCHLSHHF